MLQMSLSRSALTELKAMFARLSLFDDGGLLAELQVKPFRQIENGNNVNFGLNGEWVLYFRGRICVPKDTDSRQTILRGAHSSPYAIHPGENKMYRDSPYAIHLGGNKMYRDLCEVKGEHELPSKLLQLVKILMWKWERVTMDFISGLPLTPSKKDSVWVIVGRLTKTAHFIPRVLGPELVSNTEDKFRLIRDRLKEASDRQKSYTDLKCKEIEYSVGDFVFLKVSPWKKVLRFRRKGKLRPRFIGPYSILRQVGPITYQLELPPELERIHDVFHVSLLRCYHSNPSHVVSVEEIKVKQNLTFEEEPVQILYREVKVLKKKSIPLVKVL
ncbi:uncharacterized protein [Gossypium hirsutum]|uniref:Tf2-1-like SH3-like domain-containing protein n=1 Tax=Gossypium hirsutum TaxID=3635 RepID=A0ABM2ZC07_GOSHI|nr:uncharacterized protein LOC121211215 [Gossypium hirsutum]